MDPIQKYSYVISDIEVGPDENGQGEKSCVGIKEEFIDSIEGEAVLNDHIVQLFTFRDENGDILAFDCVKVEPESPTGEIGDDRFFPGCSNSAGPQCALNEAGSSREYHKVKDTKNELNRRVLLNERLKNSGVTADTGKSIRRLNLMKDPKKRKCKICYGIYSSKSTLSRHLAHHRNWKRYVCPICGITSERLSTLIRHRAKHTSSKQRDVHKAAVDVRVSVPDEIPYTTVHDIFPKRSEVPLSQSDSVLNMTAPVQDVMKIGQQFSTFEDVQRAVHKYSELCYNEYIIGDCVKLETQKKRSSNTRALKAPEEIQYFYVKFFCVRHGSWIKRGNTRNTTTIRGGCMARIHFRLSACGMFLEVREIVENHNHETSEAIFRSLPRQRHNLEKQVKETFAKILARGANKKKVLREMINRRSSLSAFCAKPNPQSIEKCIHELRTVYGCEVHTKINDDNLLGLYFQDKTMKEYLKAFPEIILINGTYCLLNNKAIAYIIVVEDGEGRSVIVAVGIFVIESQEMINWFFEVFVANNGINEQVKIVMTDNDVKERKTIQKYFPHAKMLLCLFDTLKIIEREVNLNKFKNLKVNEINTAKQYISKLACSKSESDYMAIYELMSNNIHTDIKTYYDTNWHNIRTEWVTGFVSNNECYGAKTNNNKLKSVIKKHSFLEDFFFNFFIHIEAQRSAHVETMIKYSKRSLTVFDPSESQYYNLLTIYAFKKLQRQLKMAKNAELPEHEVTHNSCGCSFRTSMGLPCKHIFKFRMDNFINLFDEKLCVERWSKAKMVSLISLKKKCESPISNDTDSNLYKDDIVTNEKTTNKSLCNNYQNFNALKEKYDELHFYFNDLSDAKCEVILGNLDLIINQVKSDNIHDLNSTETKTITKTE